GRFFFFKLSFLFKCVLWFFLFICFFLVFFFTNCMPPLSDNNSIVYSDKLFNRATNQFIYLPQHLIPGPSAKRPPFQSFYRHSPRIPSKKFSELHDAAFLSVECYIRIKMFFHSSCYVINIRTERFRPSLHILNSLPEYPWITESAPCYSRTVAP